MSNYRMEQVNSELQKTLSEIINNDLKNPIIDDEVISVTGVNTSSDLSQAKVYISILGNDDKKEKVFNEIKASKSFIRKSIASKVNLRKTPELLFFIDNSLDNGAKIMSILDDLKKKGDL